MGNTHLRIETKSRLYEYCTKNTLATMSNSVDALFVELSAYKKENKLLSELVAQYAETEKLMEEKLKCCQKNQKNDTTL